ncbi:MAG: hypothetical protein GW760_08240 [Legionella sp.]|jgi:hypothetical protein|nr:hypothetical protein [Legionella sp.]
MDLNKLFQQWIGAWRFHRKIHSQIKDAIDGTVIGSVSIKKIDETTLHYQEQGVLTTSLDAKLNMHREYVYKYCPIKNIIEKYFSINNKPSTLFYRLHFNSNQINTILTAHADHQCNQDYYEADYSFFGFFDNNLFDNFSLIYQVTGPKKAYTSETRYERLSIPYF